MITDFVFLGVYARKQYVNETKNSTWSSFGFANHVALFTLSNREPRRSFT